MTDTNREFERYMSDLGEATNPTGDGVYQSPRIRRRLDDFRAGFEAARALASRPAEVGDERQWVVVGGRRAGRTFLAALARDAERYRWMRNAQWFKAGLAKTELNASSFHYSGDLLDQLVDAGRAADRHGEGAGK